MYPENTKIAFEAALSSRADMLEIDIHRTLDQQLVVIHDETIDRTSNGNGKVADYTLASLKQFDFGISRGLQFKGQSILLLDDVLAMVKDAPQKLLIELKQPKLYPEIEKELIKKLKTYNMAEDKVIIQSFDQQLIQKLHNLNVGYKLGVLISRKQYWYRSPNFKKIARYANYINPHYSLVTKKFLTKAKQNGLLVMPYTVNEEKLAHKLIMLGVHGLISDNPEILMRKT
ncbi:glycerophosphodiester phosphodiesterase [Staphylococcus edaphicus]|uniref:Glycerophosphodiester phosphodiesterase n=2 Tax=Staphylococcus edaphicus TaxID=1955013 RepID=A0A2C6VLH8_9STAP|nr:glycerophosphodiester phosphodiesterase [Staphylococcus edaphicus]UQW82766.1 glycerophosphodiester phosphodiesterase [Staphylococcus edaphicus]